MLQKTAGWLLLRPRLTRKKSFATGQTSLSLVVLSWRLYARRVQKSPLFNSPGLHGADAGAASDYIAAHQAKRQLTTYERRPIDAAVESGVQKVEHSRYQTAPEKRHQ